MFFRLILTFVSALLFGALLTPVHAAEVCLVSAVCDGANDGLIYEYQRYQVKDENIPDAIHLNVIWSIDGKESESKTHQSWNSRLCNQCSDETLTKQMWEDYKANYGACTDSLKELKKSSALCPKPDQTKRRKNRSEI